MTPELTMMVEVVGWLGAVLILLAYGLLSAGKLTSASPAYHWLNVFGAAGFIVNSWVNGATPSAALNVVWMMIGVVALWRMTRARSSPSGT